MTVLSKFALGLSVLSGVTQGLKVEQQREGFGFGQKQTILQRFRELKRDTPCKDIKDKDKHTECCMKQSNPLTENQKEYTVELRNFQNVQYYGDITIGTTTKDGNKDVPQIFPAIYDTGSFEILVLSELCEQCQTENYDDDTPLYTQKHSTTFSLFPTSDQEKRAAEELKKCKAEVKADNSGDQCVYQTVEAQHVFGSGPVESVRGYETVRMGSVNGGEGFQNSPVLPRFPFWQIKRHAIEAWDAGAKFSAIVGLGPRDFVPDMGGGEDESEQVPTLLDKADVNKFSICLQRSGNQVIASSQEAKDGSSQQEAWPSGYLTFNAHTPQTEKLVQVVGEVHWAVKMHHFGAKVNNANNNMVNICGKKYADNGCAAIIDSGTSLIAAPRSAIEGLVTELGIKEDCSNMKHLPNLEFSFGEGDMTEHFSLPPSAYVMRVEQLKETTGIWDWLLAQPRKFQEETVCVPAFMPLDKDSNLGPVFIMGMSFLRHYKTTYVRAIKSCEPKMYFDRVDKHCNKVNKASLLSHLNAGNSTSIKADLDAESYMPMEVTASALEGVKLPTWAQGSGSVGV